MQAFSFSCQNLGFISQSKKNVLPALYKPPFPLDNKQMNFDFSLFFLAVGLAFALEACMWIIVPSRMKEAVRVLIQLADGQLRTWGLVLLSIGLLLCAIGRYLKG